MTTRHHPSPIRPDFHCSLLWQYRTMRGHSPVLMLSELEMVDLFARYRSPWRA